MRVCIDMHVITMYLRVTVKRRKRKADLICNKGQLEKVYVLHREVERKWTHGKSLRQGIETYYRM